MTQLTKPIRYFSPLFTAIILSSLVITLPMELNAQATPQNADKTQSSQKMDHSKMGDMKHMDGMSMTGDADHDFAVNMRKHHQMALPMLEDEIKKGKDPKMVQMAKDMMATQKKEITELDKWIQSHKKPQ